MDGRTFSAPGPADGPLSEAHGQALVAPYLMSLATAIRRAAATVYRREFGLGQNEWRIVSVLGLDGALSNNEIAELVALDKGQLSREVSRLVERGLVVRHRAHRSTEIRLSGDGQAVYRRLITIADCRNRHLLADLAESDREHLFALLGLIRVRATEMLQDEKAA